MNPNQERVYYETGRTYRQPLDQPSEGTLKDHQSLPAPPNERGHVPAQSAHEQLVEPGNGQPQPTLSEQTDSARQDQDGSDAARKRAAERLKQARANSVDVRTLEYRRERDRAEVLAGAWRDESVASR